MISFVLAVAASLLPHWPQQQRRPSRYLPDDRTLVCLELPEPQRVVDERARILQVVVFGRSGVRRQLARATEKKRGFGRVWTNVDKLVDMARRLDRGLLAASRRR